MKKALLALTFAIVATGAVAQGISRTTEELARVGSAFGARIEVRYEGDAEAAVRNADHTSARTAVMTYGVSLFRDNSQNAGSNAEAVKKRFAETYPGVHVSLSYENPWFKVEAGPFVDRTDAVALCGKVLAEFRQAVVIQREVPLSEIITIERAGSATSVEPEE